MSAYEIAAYIRSHELPAVLATLVAVEGHSYRKPGAVMLFHEGGTLGSLSPGCLESDLQLRTREIWESGRPEMVEYDMRSSDDFSWGEAVGCGGKIKVALEPVRGELRLQLVEASAQMDGGKSLLLRRSRTPGGYAYRLEEEPSVTQQQRKHQWQYGSSDDDEEAFATPLIPKPRLVLFGAGQDSRSVAELASRSGFRIAAADWREGPLMNGFPAGERALCLPEEVPEKLNIGSGDYVLICSHQLQRDRRFLEAVIPRHPKYIGIIGSKARIGLLLDGLEKAESLHAPVGLPIGADGPEEIAVSIVAELIQVRRADIRLKQKGDDRVEDSRDLFGGRAEQSNGGIQSFKEAVAGRRPRERRAR
ncbi:XdhC family protein [Paenibacillus sp. HN-1]|uniref:XdhC family protein n=1 Tax=Paenibacillus TaxID=44249 RepID=UPI001CA91630|nr:MULTISPECIES: XdhC family protein [Paenibacillus]MBY9080827.1 XdhC family protein [Paenibacillus sp. CGMCC 1.18879]MBY9085181.1 XdhC family protein [Paenibacillus sinensis]